MQENNYDCGMFVTLVPEVFLDFSLCERAAKRRERKQGFISRRFAALSRREKSRKTSGTRADVCLHGKKKTIDY